MRQPDDSDHSISFRGGEWKVTKGAMVIARGKKRNISYMTTEPGNVIAITAGNDNVSLWHNKLGHMSQKGMKELFSKGKLPKMKNVHFDIVRIVYGDAKKA